jgi:hypothetical protein
MNKLIDKLTEFELDINLSRAYQRGTPGELTDKPSTKSLIHISATPTST